MDLLILFALVCGAFWKLTLTGDYTWANQSDMSDQVLPWLQFQAVEWQAGRWFPLWDPYHWGGQSLIGQLQPAVMYPFNWILFLWPLDAAGHISLRVLGWYLVLSRFLGAGFFYWLVRDIGGSRLAAIFGGALFACTGYVGTTEWPQVVNGTIWEPLVLLFGLRLIRRIPVFSVRWLLPACCIGGVLGMSILAGHYQVPSHLFLLAGALVAIAALRRRAWRLGLAAGALCLLFAFLVGAVQILPAAEYWKTAMRWIGSGEPLRFGERVPFPAHATDSLDPVSLVGIVIPRIHTALANPYAGFAALVLAVFAVFTTWRRSAATRTLAILGVLFVVFSFGAATWFYGVAYALIPGLEKSRHPAAAVALWHMCLVALASIGLDRLRSVGRRNPALLRRSAAALLAFSVFVYGTMVYLSLADPKRVFGRNEQSMAAFTALLLAVALFGYGRGAIPSAALRGVCLVIAMIEASNVAGYSYFHSSQGWTQLEPLYGGKAGAAGGDADLAEFLRKEPGRVRVNFDRSEIPYNFGDWWGIEQYQGYTGVPEPLFQKAFEPGTRRLLGETHWITKSPEWNGLQPVWQSGRKLYVYRVPGGASPLAWLVAEAGCPAAAATGQQVPPVRVLRRQPKEWEIEAKVEGCRAQLVVNDGWSPGWVAEDAGGNVLEVRPYAGLLKAVTLEPGAKPQLVSLQYRPGSVRWGALGTATGCISLLCLAGWVLYRRRGAKVAA